MYNKTITLFNRYNSRAGDMWYPTIIRNVDLIVDKALIVAKLGENSSDKAMLHVKYSIGYGNTAAPDEELYPSDTLYPGMTVPGVITPSDELFPSNALYPGAKVDDSYAVIAGKKYLPPKRWDRQTNDKLAKTLTFTSGQNFDFFIVGEYDDTEPIADNDFDDGFYDYMNRQLDEVYAVTSVAMYGLIPHLEVIAK